MLEIQTGRTCLLHYRKSFLLARRAIYKSFFAAYGGLFISVVARFCCRWQQNRATTETFANCQMQ
jgi:hypothetical protein